MKWFAHVTWGALFPCLWRPPYEAAFYALAHTVLTDTLGHHGLRRSAYHDVLSMVFAIIIATSVSPVYLWLGVIHIVLDRLSPGRLGVSFTYSLVWTLVALILYIALKC
jgi:hypothetical protein